MIKKVFYIYKIYVLIFSEGVTLPNTERNKPTFFRSSPAVPVQNIQQVLVNSSTRKTVPRARSTNLKSDNGIIDENVTTYVKRGLYVMINFYIFQKYVESVNDKLYIWCNFQIHEKENKAHYNNSIAKQVRISVFN